MKTTKKTAQPEAADGHTIKVAAHLTGVPIETLRVWERRYAFPKPARKLTGVRQYSDDDIARLRVVARAVEAGFRPSEVMHLPAAKVLGLLQTRPDRDELVDESTATASPELPAIEGLLEQLRAGNVEELQRRLRTLATSLGPKAFVTELAHPLAVRLGELWAMGKLAIHQEHIATECLSTQLRLMLSQFQGATPRPLVLLANLPDEPHRLPLELVAVYIASNRATPHLIGLQTPPLELAAAAAAYHASAVGLTVTAQPVGDATKRMLAQLRRDLPKTTALWVGGAHATEVAPRGAQIINSWHALDAALAAKRPSGTR